MEYVKDYSCPECGHDVGCIITLADAKLLMCDKCGHRKVIERWDPPLHCPKCGSTAVATGARGISGFWGPIGANKTVNRCGNCGNTWTPRR